LDEENPTNASLAQENSFASAELRKLPWLIKGAAANIVHLQKRV